MSLMSPGVIFILRIFTQGTFLYFPHSQRLDTVQWGIFMARLLVDLDTCFRKILQLTPHYVQEVSAL